MTLDKAIALITEWLEIDRLIIGDAPEGEFAQFIIEMDEVFEFALGIMREKKDA